MLGEQEESRIPGRTHETVGNIERNICSGRQCAGHGHICTIGRECLWPGLKNGQVGLKLWVPVRTKLDKVVQI